MSGRPHPWIRLAILLLGGWLPGVASADPPDGDFLGRHCFACHAAESRKGGLDLSALPLDLADEANFATWVAVHDRVADGEMPPPKRARPDAEEVKAWLAELDARLVAADASRRRGSGRAALRRLTRTEFENALRDLLALPHLRVKDLLPADGTRHHLDKVGEALDFSHVQVARYMEAADRALDAAIATRATSPPVLRRRVYPASSLKFLQNLAGGNAVLIRDRGPDPLWPAPGTIPDGNWSINFEKAIAGGVRDSKSAVAVFHPDMEGWRTSFNVAPVFAGPYRLRLSTWSMGWDAGKVGPSHRTEVATLHVGPRTLGYFDAPSLAPRVHELTPWLDVGDELVFDAASLYYPGQPVLQHPGGAAAYTGPALAVDWLDVEGPVYQSWPPEAHRRLFGDLPLEPLELSGGIRPPSRAKVGQSHPWCMPATWEFPPEEANPPLVSVASKRPLEDAESLLKAFLPKAFRRDVADAEVDQYVALVGDRLGEKGCFEDAMRFAYKAAITSPHFLLRRESAGRLDGAALATRLALWLWDSTPDEELLALGREGRLGRPDVLRGQVERLLRDRRSERFVANFLDQWLNLQAIDATDPDHGLYPEFNLYLKESMLAESRAYFRELLEDDLPISCLIASDFAMLNRRLAEHYGIGGVEGCTIRRVPLPPGSGRGGFLTQGAVLKVSANGTVTSPVVRGVYVSERILGQRVPPQPPNIPAIDPDTRGATTIREQLEKHRTARSCAACHARLDPPGLALEGYDVIGGWRDHYRSLGAGEPVAVRLNGQGVGYRRGPPVDASGRTAQGEPFADFPGFQRLILARPKGLARNLASQLITYATGAEPNYGDRRELDRIVSRSEADGHGLRQLIHAIAQSELFLSR